MHIDDITKDINDSLSNLKCDYFDLYLLHRDDEEMFNDLEIIVNNIDQEAQIYKNNSNNNFIKIKLIGDSLNPNGIGSRVFVNSGELSQMQELTLTRGFQSSVSPTLNFGLGKNDEIDQVKVIWPNGQEEIINNINDVSKFYFYQHFNN